MALAVSGGSDSVALMCLARDWARTHHIGLTLTVLTVDHDLRSGSAVEALRVAGWASDLGLPHHILHWSGEKPASGIQARAREARYRLMRDWCSMAGAGLLLTAHTLDDQAETVLMRLSRTTSPDSLAGIASFGAWGGLALFRPLLGLRRQALRDDLLQRGQPWIEDPSNDDPRFERVRIRRQLAGLAACGITPERLADLALAAARTAARLEHLATAWTRQFVAEDEAGLCHVPSEPLNSLPLPLRQRILGRIVCHYGGGQASPEPHELRRLAAWVEEGPVRCTLAGALLGRRKTGFWVTREAARISPEPLIVPAAGRALWDGRFLVTAPPGTRITAAAGRQVPLAPAIPAYARRAYPLPEPPEGQPGKVSIGFLKLNPA